MKTVSETAKLAGISVRTLHYYDQIGLLCPKTTESGYRMYSDTDLDRLWQILFFRELDFPLTQIKTIMKHASYNRDEALREHRQLLTEKKKRLEQLITTIDTTLTKGFDVNMLKTFDSSAIDAHKEKYAQEAAEKYGDLYKQSVAKTSTYTDQDWQSHMNEAQQIFDGLAACMERDPGSAEAQALVGKWRAHITAHYYDCTVEILKGLGELYTADERFTRNIDKTKPGLAEFMKNAIEIYCKNNK